MVLIHFNNRRRAAVYPIWPLSKTACGATSLVLFGSLIATTIYIFVFALMLIVNQMVIGGTMPLNPPLPTILIWTTVSTDVTTFVRSWILCLSTTGGGKVARPFGPAVHFIKSIDLV